MASLKSKSYLIFHISSYRVVGAVVGYNEKTNKPEIKHLSQKKIFFDLNISASFFKENMEKTLEEVCESLETYTNISNLTRGLQGAYVFLTSPWVEKRVNIKKEERVRDFKLDDDFMRDFIESVGNLNNDEVFISSKINSAYANAYPVKISDLENKFVSSLEISFLENIMLSGDKKRIEGVLQKYFPFIKISYDTFMNSAFSFFSEFLDMEKDYFLVDFTGEFMDLVLVRGGKIERVGNLNTGRNKIIRLIMSAGHALNVRDGEYLLRAYLRGELDEEYKDGVSEVIKKEESRILKFKDDLCEGLSRHQIPDEAYIISDLDINKIVEEISLTDKISFLRKSDLKRVVELSEGTDWSNFLAVEARYIFKEVLGG